MSLRLEAAMGIFLALMAGAISDALAYTDSLRNRDEWRSLPRMVAPRYFRKRVL
jgi:hypothetical protein